MNDDLVGRRLGGFRLDERLGAGAHGSVWRARQVRLDRDVAVKVLDPVVARNPEAARRFEREGRAAASLDHPNIVPVYEAGDEDGLVYLAMRLVDGETLEDLIEREAPLTVDRVVELLTPVAAAIDHAHARELIHRDVKPSNILLEGDHVWLADFGIAASVRELGSYTTGALGTAEYMAPEQANAADVDHRADLYALGCVAYHALTGSPPYPGTDLVSTLMAHAAEPVPSTGDAALDACFATALAKDPADRFTSARELVGALAEAGATGTAAAPTTAPSPSTRSSARRRRWRPVALVALVATLAVAIVAWVTGGDGDDDPAATGATATTVPGAEPTDPPGPDPTGPPGSGGTEPVTTPVPSTLEIVPGGSVEVGTTRLLTSVDPHVDRFAEPFVTGHVLPPLVMVDESWELEPWLAADLPQVVGEDPLTVRWTLRPDATWDDGSPVTSADVARTLDYIQDPDSGATGTLLYDGVTIRIVDDLTFDVVFAEPTGAYDVLFSTIHPVISAAAYDAHLAGGGSPATFLADGIGFSAGPYRVLGFDAGERLTLGRNEAYWGTPANLDRITIRRYETVGDQLEAVETGEIDLAHVEDGRAGDASEARTFDDTTVTTGVADQYLRLDFNTRRGPFADPLVRRAVATGVDRAPLVGAAVSPITGEGASPHQSLVWPSTDARSSDPFARFDGDPDTAGALLQDAGWSLDGGGARRRADGTRLEVRIVHRQAAPLGEQAVVLNVSAQLSALGFDVVATPLDPDAFDAARAGGDHDLAIVPDAVNVDPVATGFRFGSEFCPATFDAEGCDSELGSNLTGIADAELDALLDQAASTVDRTERADLYRRIDERLAEVVPALPLYELPTFVAHIDRLGGVGIDAARGGPFADLDEWGLLEPVELE